MDRIFKKEKKEKEKNKLVSKIAFATRFVSHVPQFRVS